MYQTWEELEEACKNCNKCKLCANRHNVVIGTGNRKLQIYGVEIITVREFKRNENHNKTFWKLIRI